MGQFERAIMGVICMAFPTLKTCNNNRQNVILRFAMVINSLNKFSRQIQPSAFYFSLSFFQQNKLTRIYETGTYLTTAEKLLMELFGGSDAKLQTLRPTNEKPLHTEKGVSIFISKKRWIDSKAFRSGEWRLDERP